MTTQATLNAGMARAVGDGLWAALLSFAVGFVVLLAIIVVAAFCITNTTIVMAVQKRREIGLMRALGAKTSQIIALFTNNGIVIGIMGVTMGYIGGNVFLHYRNRGESR